MKKIFLLSLIALVAISCIPSSVFASACYSPGTPGNFRDVVCLFVDLVSTTIPVVAGIALLVFFWGLAKFILHANEETAVEEGKEIMKWGIVALFVMVSVWGIVSLVHSDFISTSPIGVPQLPQQ